MVPDQSVLTSDQGTELDRVRSARAEAGSFLIAYVPSGRPVSVNMDKITGKKVKARWYDPRTGKWREIGEFPNTGVREFVTPSKGDRDDWVLVLDDLEKGYPTELRK
jgi:hypothetical protein